jgi:uncharacterized protein (TIGR03435 family)
MMAVMRKETLALIFALGLLRAQQARLEFEVASIKPAAPQPIGHVSTRTSTNHATQSEPGRLNYTYVNVQQVLCEAYRVFLYQLSGGPAWLETDRFDISAVIPAGTQRNQVPLMLQALLVDRFRLALHREMREMSVYALVVSKNGPKFKAAQSSTGISSHSDGGPIHVTAAIGMDGFANYLSQRLDRPVLDQTGLKGPFEITMDWAPDSLQRPGAGDDLSGPSIFTALQEQLGLKLEGRRAPIEILVIDRAEKPSEN